MLHHIDFAHQMKHFTICSLVSQSHFQWKSMVIKINQQKAALFIFLLCLLAVIVVLFSFFLATLSSQLIGLKAILQISGTHVHRLRQKNNISIIFFRGKKKSR